MSARLAPARLGRVAAFAVLALVILAALVVVSHGLGRSATRPVTAPESPVAAALERCHGLGSEAVKDPACRDAWKRAREHFFGQDEVRL